MLCILHKYCTIEPKVWCTRKMILLEIWWTLAVLPAFAMWESPAAAAKKKTWYRQRNVLDSPFCLISFPSFSLCRCWFFTHVLWKWFILAHTKQLHRIVHFICLYQNILKLEHLHRVSHFHFHLLLFRLYIICLIFCLFGYYPFQFIVQSNGAAMSILISSFLGVFSLQKPMSFWNMCVCVCVWRSAAVLLLILSVRFSLCEYHIA